jgi:L-ascorbate oxidase
VEAARQNIDKAMADTIIKDLKNNLRLTAFAAHPDLTNAKVENEQVAVYNIDLKATPFRFEINGKVFDPKFIRRLTLGAVDDWILSSHWEGHPHHIHVNPFQIISVTDPNGKDVSAPGAIDDYTGEIDNQFAGLKGVWKDTIWIKNPVKGPSGAYTIRVRMKYLRYIGEFVFHCHILDHEDQGMMESVSIELPGMSAASGAGGHGHH